ncbi:hypothetical protein H7J06_09040 [Mycobacterium hodleri]|uniref:DUF6912 family protein n=1 Tax=Mycolicibacterium hodleri TaxID=49897 RepID=UPI0021F2E036|nr:hypothetical protein [Mycolicibacterium hodleri]MCV7133135.1 hypothetical protein [Mycolicibacterium hodleri]
MVRVYIPATLAMLQRLVADQSMHALSGTAFAVTPTLRESYAEGDDDELAEVALREAALASLRLLAAEEADDGQERSDRGSDDGLPLRRAVLVADVEGATIRPDLDDAVVRLAGPIGVGDVVAAYLDNAAAEPAVRAAIAVVDLADFGDEDAELTVGDAQDHDLAWYATQELPFLLELL